MDEIDRVLVGTLQEGIELAERPFQALAERLHTSEEEIVRRIGKLLDEGVLTRFGPMYDAERMGGAYILAALCVPRADYERVAALVNARPEVAHNYEREHAYNMWFVVGAERGEQAFEAIGAIERETGLSALVLPRLAAYGLGLKLEVGR